VISEARIGRHSQTVIASVVGVACLFIVATAIPSGVLLITMALAVTMFVLTALVLRMTVTIELLANNMVVRCRPFYAKTIPLADIVDASPAQSSSMTEGFGIRYLGQRTWGLLVGGPAIAVETSNRTWIISTPEPAVTATAILANTGS
jgi:hypothetical protein